MARENLGLGPTIDADLVRQVDMYPAFSATFPVGTGAWTTYVPVWTQTATITATINTARYTQIGRIVFFEVSLTATSAGTAGAFVRVTLPVAPASSDQVVVAAYADASPATSYVLGGFTKTGTNDMIFLNDTSGSAAFGNAPAVTVASGDAIYIAGHYEAAAGGNPTASPTAAWVSYTPTLVQSGAVTATVTYAKYTQVGRTVTGTVHLAVTGTGTGTNQVEIGLPVAASQSAVSLPMGTGYIFDSSATAIFKGELFTQTATSVVMVATSDTTTARLGAGAGFTAALASPDVVAITFCYEAAAGGGIPPVSYAWTDYVPSFSQGATITKTVTEARYTQVGRTVTMKFQLVATSSGTAASIVLVGLPVAALTVGGSIGAFTFQDASTGQLYSGAAVLQTSTSIQFITSGTNLFGATGSTFALAVAATDQIAGTVTYEAA